MEQIDFIVRELDGLRMQIDALRMQMNFLHGQFGAVLLALVGLIWQVRRNGKKPREKNKKKQRW